MAVVGVLCAGYWFGNSGAGLALLWWESRRRSVSGGRRSAAGWIDRLDDDELIFAYVGAYRIVVVGRRCGRREVFRDELSELAWVRLRRRCWAVQPATGRSTSI
ncbi:MAG TPA: hypothetical protein VIS76_06175 [Pseudomonadales bacterium]